MKILHTADWHLGQKLRNFNRIQEHEMALNWLFDVIIEQEIDLLIVSGDVFDVLSPTNAARRLYYQFLAKLMHSPCKYVVIVGGNHDSPNMLNAPSELLVGLNIFVIGCATENIENEIIELKNDGNIEAVIAAVPFLRDQDIRKSTIGETEMERFEQVQKGIINHYSEIAEIVERYDNLDIPIIATGHLYATGATTLNEKQDNIYMGSVENIAAKDFPSIFDYIALGHIHTAQPIGNKRHIRYSGSIIPLSFKESKETKSVTLVEINGKTPETIQQLTVPKYRDLIEVKGNYEEVMEKIEALEVPELTFKTWLKAEVKVEKYEYELEENIRLKCEEKGIILLILKMIASYSEEVEYEYHVNLDDLEPKDIFIKKCESANLSEEETKEMMVAFHDLMEWEAAREEE